MPSQLSDNWLIPNDMAYEQVLNQNAYRQYFEKIGSSSIKEKEVRYLPRYPHRRTEYPEFDFDERIGKNFIIQFSNIH